MLFWAHLSKAGLIAATYTGFPIDLASTSSETSTYYQKGVNTPPIGPHGAMAAAFTFPQTLTFVTSPIMGYHFGRAAKLSYMLGTIKTTLWPNSPGFTSKEAYTLDSKMDDGNPYTGRLYGFGSNTGCVTPPDQYNFSMTGINCLVGYVGE